MSLSRTIYACLLANCLASSACGAESEPQMVVLRNGNVLHGIVEQQGTYLRLASPGSELHLRSADVDFLCESVEAAYEKLRARNLPPTAIGHLQLASWCVRQELWDAADAELAAARQLEPKHPRLAILEQTLDHLKHVAQAPRHTADLGPAQRAPVSTPNREASLATAELMVDLPKGALEDFTRRVQPILVNNCTTSGCHQANGPQKFQLNRDLLHGMANRRSTMRNLTATLALIDAESPLDSQLLAIASASHAGKTAPPLPVHQRELHQRLEEWVWLVSGKQPPQPASPDPSVQLATHAAMQPGAVIPAIATEPADAIEAAIEEAFGDKALLAPRSPTPLRVGAQLQPWTPRDEFDPEIFNRQQSTAVEALPTMK